ncbi:MAG: hypothetical protein J6K97_00210 [Clostridia bacterium]|nr:hypothetical protein [Clostridia bacterium]
MDIKIPQKIEQMFANQSTWFKLFVVNYYNGKDKILPQNKTTRVDEINKDIENALFELYRFSENEENFVINTSNNPELEREYHARVNFYQAQGDNDSLNEYLSSKQLKLVEIAQKQQKIQFEEFRHIVQSIKTMDYEPAFKYLMLKETLEKTYKQDKDISGTKTIVKKREPHITLAGHMTLNTTLLQIIHDNVSSYPNFASLYFAGMGVFNQSIAENSDINLAKLNTFGMGKWIKFEGKKSNKEEYLDNAQRLASLVQDTQWCTKTLAASQLAQGDFFVFVDNEGKPRVAIKMNGNQVDEVRGIAGGQEQALEEEYRKIAVEFLTKNEGIRFGKEWLEKEKWNNRLLGYEKAIITEKFDISDFDNMIYDLVAFKDYKPHAMENSNKERLLLLIAESPILSSKLAEKFGCSVEEIAFSGAKFDGLKSSPYSVVFGLTYFSGYQEKELEKLKRIFGNAVFRDSEIESLGSLEVIQGVASFDGSKVCDLGSLRLINGNVLFGSAEIKSLNNLAYIGGNVSFEDTLVEDLGNLSHVGGSVTFENSKITSLTKLEIVEGNLLLAGSKITDISSLKFVGGKLALDKEQEILFADYIYKDKQGFWRFKNKLEKSLDEFGRVSFEENEEEYQNIT